MKKLTWVKGLLVELFRGLSGQYLRDRLDLIESKQELLLLEVRSLPCRKSGKCERLPL